MKIETLKTYWTVAKWAAIIWILLLISSALMLLLEDPNYDIVTTIDISARLSGMVAFGMASVILCCIIEWFIGDHSSK